MLILERAERPFFYWCRYRDGVFEIGSRTDSKKPSRQRHKNNIRHNQAQIARNSYRLILAYGLYLNPLRYDSFWTPLCPVMPRRVQEGLSGSARRGDAGMQRVFRRGWGCPFGKPRLNLRSAGKKRSTEIIPSRFLPLVEMTRFTKQLLINAE